MPEPKANENQNDFIGRCVPFMMDEGKTQDEALGACYGIWEVKKSLIKNADKFVKCISSKKRKSI
jgi:hypothetical protein